MVIVTAREIPAPGRPGDTWRAPMAKEAEWEGLIEAVYSRTPYGPRKDKLQKGGKQECTISPQEYTINPQQYPTPHKYTYMYVPL